MASPAIKFCIERERLVRAYTTAALRHNRLLIQRILAEIKGLEPPSPAEITEADTKKENAKIAILAHQREHGC